MIVSGQELLSDTSETQATVGLAVQLSASSVTTVTSGAGTSATHSTLMSGGLEAVGSVVSLMIIFCTTLMELLQSSVML